MSDRWTRLACAQAPLDALVDTTMNNGIFIIAHAPLATALRQCALHVYPDAAKRIMAFDVPASNEVSQTCLHVQQRMQAFGWDGALVLTDVFGATPCNVARGLPADLHVRLLAGVNLPMLLRAVNYLDQSLDTLTEKALTGGEQGVMQVPCQTTNTENIEPHG